MAKIDTTALGVLGEQGSRRATLKAKAVEWKPLDLATLVPGVYVACDPSFTALGLVLFEVGPERDWWTVHLAETFRTDPQDTGWEGNFIRTETIEVRLRAYFEQWVSASDWGAVYAVHEAPPVGGQLRRIEATVLGGYAFRRASYGYPRLPMVARRVHAKLICGQSNADKKVEHAFLKNLLPSIGGRELITNEATRDALCVALAAAYKGY